MKIVRKIINTICDIFRWFSMIAVAIVVLIMLLDTILRLPIFNSSILGSYEIVEFLMLFITSFALAYCEKEGEHVAITILTETFPQKLRYAVKSIGLLAGTALMGISVYAIFMQAQRMFTVNNTSATLHIPLYPFYYFLSAAVGVFALALLLHVIDNLILVFSKNLPQDQDMDKLAQEINLIMDQ